MQKMATEEWKSVRKHRMEKMHRVIYRHGLHVVTERFARVKVGVKKEPGALSKGTAVYSH